MDKDNCKTCECKDVCTPEMKELVELNIYTQEECVRLMSTPKKD